jgi:glutamate decarboxylase
LKAAGQPVPNREGVVRNVLVTSRKPEELVQQLALALPKGEGRGEEGLLETIRNVLDFSVNTWDQGFLDKLYASTNAVSLSRDDLGLQTNTG